METGKHRPSMGPVEINATCRFESCLQRVTIFQHIDPNDCLGRLTIVQQCVEIWLILGFTRGQREYRL
jgi:hypothetical protein